MAVSCAYGFAFVTVKYLFFITFNRESCLAVKDLFCFDEWLLVQNNRNEGVFFRTRGHFRLPVCEDLPSQHNHSAVCTDAKLFDVKPNQFTGM